MSERSRRPCVNCSVRGWGPIDLQPLPSFDSGGASVDVADRNALYDASIEPIDPFVAES